jgi:NAD(P)H-hydrate epimerase
VSGKEEGGDGLRKKLRGIVIDADALRLIASDQELDGLMKARDRSTECILTPHLAEFADLVHVSVKKAAKDRIPLMRELCERYSCTVLGKDARTLIVSKGRRQICMITNGNSGMATAGSGDVLTGITAAMLFAVSPGEDPGYRAAAAAAYIHAEAGDLCKKDLGERAMIAGDLIAALGRAAALITDNI